MTTYLAQANTGADTLASTRTVTKPAGVTAGAVGVFWLVRWHESGSFPAVTPPAGAVLRGTITTTSMQTQCYLHRVAAETSFAYTWTSGRWSTLAAVWFAGVDPAVDLASVPFQSATGSGTAIGALTVTSDIDSALAWHVNTIDTSGVTHNPPAGFTEVADASPAASAYRIAVASGSQTADGGTASPTSNWAAGLVALPPAPAAGATGDANLTATAALAAGGTRGVQGTTGLAATAALAGSGLRSATAGAGLAASADRTAAGVRGAATGAGLDAAAVLDADGAVASHQAGDAVLDVHAGLTSSGQRATTASTGLAGAAALTAEGSAGRAGHAALAATAGLTAAGAHGATAGASLAATAVLTARGVSSGSSPDDVDVTVGAPYSHWTASAPRPSAWTAAPPRADNWRVGAPW
ncbi:hypothetical protein OIE75_29740 [Streptomyces sp. NBC_01723]|uniref:hypothetical protein n=1 Tax=Streptomyces sp. NBC_01723 TaxID=2975921 RepID=UPI002E30138C|nr:hypothetical protein [Streptomyces sp. NBC_01723]